MDERSRSALLESVELISAGQPTGSLPLAEADPEVGFAVALLDFAARRFHEAVRGFEQVAREPAWKTLGLVRVVACTSMLGWERERFEAAARLREGASSTARLDRSELLMCRRLGDPEGASALARRLLQADPNQLDVRIELAGCLAESGELPALREELGLLSRASALRLEVLLERSRLHVEADQCDEAEALAVQAQAAWPQEAAPSIALARFAAWRGDGTAAETWARRATTAAPASADAWCALGAALHTRGAHAEGAVAIARACELEPAHGEAHTWRAEEAWARGERALMDQDLTVAVRAASRSLPVTAWLLRSLGNPDASRNGRPQLGNDESAAALDELVPSAREGARGDDLLRQALGASGGNRSVQPTMMREGRLRRLTARLGPRLASRNALERVRFEHPGLVATRLEELSARFPRSSMPLVHRGELWLWRGRLDEAEADFRSALERVHATRFAWIGLTAVELLRGRLEAALEVSAEGVRVMHDTAGPAVFVYRGEVLRRLGRLDEAQADLEAAVAISPRRLAASMNLALVHHASGRHVEGAGLFAHVEDCAPGLIADARREVGKASAWPALLEHSLVMMHGNRSSSCPLYESGGVLRSVPNRPGSARALHRRDQQDLLRLRSALQGRRPLLRAFASQE